MRAEKTEIFVRVETNICFNPCVPGGFKNL